MPWDHHSNWCQHWNLWCNTNNLHRFGGKTHVLQQSCLFMTINSPLKIDFLELHMEILMQQLLHRNKKICCWSKFLYIKRIISLQTGSWLKSCKMTGHEGACFGYFWCTRQYIWTQKEHQDHWVKVNVTGVIISKVLSLYVYILGRMSINFYSVKVQLKGIEKNFLRLSVQVSIRKPL